MKRNHWLYLSAAAVLTVTLVPFPLQTTLADSAKSDDIVLLYTNDVHCATDSGIGYDGLKLYKRELEAQYEHVFLVDAGDAIQGGPLGMLSQGSDIISIMNEVGYDACVPGNHEFDYRMDALLERSEELECGYISCNITDLSEDQIVFDPYTIVEAGDTKIAFVGVTTPETLSKSTPSCFQDEDGNYIYSFAEEDAQLYQCVQDSVDAAREEDADYVILLAHLGENDVTPEWSAQEVIAHTTGIDAVIDGHSHEETPSLKAKNADGDTMTITQTGSKLTNIGELVISSGGKLTAKLIDSVPEPDKKWNLAEDSWMEIDDCQGKFVDTEIHESLQSLNEKLSEALGEKIGETPFKLYDSDPETGKRRVRNGETNLGNLCADAYRSVLDTDVALFNGGGLRSFIEAGDITYRETMAVMPFGNMICSAEVTGQQILDMLECGAAKYPEESGSFLHVSGMTYAIDPDIESTVRLNSKGEFVEVTGERRVHSVTIGEEPLDPDKTYTLASHDYYLKNGGDGYILSGKCELLRDSVMSDSELLAVYIRDTLKGVVPECYRDPAGEGRIQFGAAPEDQPDTTETTEPTEPETEPTTETTETAEPTEPTTEPTTVPVTDPPEPPTQPPSFPGGFDPGMFPPGFDPSMLPEGFDPSQLPPDFDWSQLMDFLNPGGGDGDDNGEGFDPSQLPPGFDPSMLPPGIDPGMLDLSKLPPDFDWSNIPEDFDWSILLKDEDTADSEQKPTEPGYVIPFLLTPRPFLTPTPVEELPERTFIPYITSVDDTPVRTAANTAPKKDSPYTGERSETAAAVCAAVLSLLTVALSRKKR